MANPRDVQLAKLQHSVQRQIQYGRSYLNQIIPPGQRQELVDMVIRFAAQRPLFSAFISLNMIFTLLPISLFLISVTVVGISTLVFTLVLGFFITLGATIFFASLALFILLPSLLIAVIVANFTWTIFTAINFLLKSSSKDPNAMTHSSTLDGLVDDHKIPVTAGRERATTLTQESVDVKNPVDKGLVNE